MKNNKYMFFIDVDDTLIPHGGNEISEDILSEIKRLKNLGHIFIISTGRSLQSILDIKGIEIFDYLAVLLGGCIYDLSKKSFLYTAKSLPIDEVDRLVKYLNKNNIEWSYKDQKNEKTIFKDSEFYNKEKNCVQVSVRSYTYDLRNNKILQLLIADYISKSVIKEFPKFEFISMPNKYMDVTSKNISKGRCVDFFVAKNPNITTVAIGDSANDLPMFKRTDISIAMGNAEKSVKEASTFVTKDINCDGLIYAFKEILKI